MKWRICQYYLILSTYLVRKSQCSVTFANELQLIFCFILSDPLVIDTLIAETNAGSVRWMNSFQQQPWSRQKLNDGELYDSLLPLGGVSVEELAAVEAQEEKERLEKELAIKEKKQKKLEKDRQKAEELLQDHVAYIKNGTSSTFGTSQNGTALLTPEGEILMNKNVERDMMTENKIFIEVSMGKVVSKSPLFPFSSNGALEDETTDVSVDMPADAEPNKVLTLADGTLVTSSDSSITSTSESNTTETAMSNNESVMNGEESIDKVVTKPSLLSSSSSDVLKDAPADAEANKVLTLADGTLVTSNNNLTISATERDTAVSDIDLPQGADGIEAKNIEDAATAIGIPPVLDDANEVPWSQVGATPDFEESSSETNIDKKSPAIPLYGTRRDDFNFEISVNDEHLDDDGIFEPGAIEWFKEIGPDGQEYREYYLSKVFWHAPLIQSVLLLNYFFNLLCTNMKQDFHRCLLTRNGLKRKKMNPMSKQ